MDALSHAIPNKTWIDEFTEKSSQAKLAGVADSDFTVADFMQAVQSSPYFVVVELGVIKKAEIRKLDLRNLVINTTLNYSGKSKAEDKNHNSA